MLHRTRSRSRSLAPINYDSWDYDDFGNGENIPGFPPATLPARPWLQAPPQGHQRSRTNVPDPDQDSLCNRPFTHCAKPVENFKLSTSVFVNDQQSDFKLSPPISPTKDKRSFLSALHKDKSAHSTPPSRVSKLSGWFDGESLPVNLSLLPSPTKEPVDPMSAASSPTSSRRPTLLTSRPTLAKPMMPSSSSILSFFSGRSASPTHSAAPSTGPTSTEDDPLLALDITLALRRAGTIDTSNMSSYNGLHQTSLDLLTRFQEALQRSTETVTHLRGEQEALDEESEEAAVRTQSLKQQLDDTSRRLAQQEAEMRELKSQLDHEKALRKEEADFRARTIRTVKHSRESYGSSSLDEPDACSDSGFESNDESAFDAQSQSSTKVGSTAPSADPSPLRFGDRHVSDEPGLRRSTVFELPIQSREVSRTLDRLNGKARIEDCRICGGMRKEEAWEVAGVLKEENKGLKERVGWLEGEMEGCLELVRGLGLA